MALWGVGEGVWQAQIGVLYAELFPSDKTAAFSNYRYFSEEIEKRRRGGLWTKEGGGVNGRGDAVWSSSLIGDWWNYSNYLFINKTL